MLCETVLKQTALTQCQLMILSFQWRRCGGKWGGGSVGVLLRRNCDCNLRPSASVPELRGRAQRSREGNEAARKDSNRGMVRLCDLLARSARWLPCLGDMQGNICCLGAQGLTLKMRKDSTSRKMFSLKWGCHNLYSSAYWQVSRGPPNVAIYTL